MPGVPSPSRKRRGALAFKAHIGWAYGVLLAEADGGVEILAKQRVTMRETFEAAAVYHVGHERGLSAKEVQPSIDAALVASVARAKEAIGAVAASTADRCSLDVAAVLAGSGRPLPALDVILRSHPLVHAAEGELYRLAVERACEAEGLRVLRLPAKGLPARAHAVLGLTQAAARARLDTAGAASGRPWTAEQRECALAAWVALASLEQ
jgi:hypothetical protein